MPIILWAFVPFVPVAALALDSAVRGSIWTAGLDVGVNPLIAKAAREAVLVEKNPAYRQQFGKVLRAAGYPKTAAYVSGAPSGYQAAGVHVGQSVQSYADVAQSSAQASFQAQISANSTPAAISATQSSAAGGALSVVSGNQPSDAQIQAGFAVGSALAMAAATGMSISAAMPVMAPIALVVFGGGYALGALVQSALGIHNMGVIACTDEDTTNGSSPSDPRWKNYAVEWPGWAPASSGTFETWARPILIRASELLLNCKPVPGAANTGHKDADFAAWQAALVAQWNGYFPGVATRTIAIDTSPRSCCGPGSTEGDPIQQMIWSFRRNAQGNPTSIEVANPTPAQAAALIQQAAPTASPKFVPGLAHLASIGQGLVYLNWNLAQWVGHYLPGVAVSISD